MAKLIARCGIRCDACPALEATRQNDDELRRKTAAEWAKTFGADIRPEHINCVGCTEPGVHIGHWDECHVRRCSQQRKLMNCGLCPDFACAELEKFFRMVPDARAELEALRQGRGT
uniref:DUF3795 domain-containing protein n=1 Tax=candidate division WOR-3 bacterium TaxID=2052148 RepID=A0A7C4GID1_UNCW3